MALTSPAQFLHPTLARAAAEIVTDVPPPPDRIEHRFRRRATATFGVPDIGSGMAAHMFGHPEPGFQSADPLIGLPPRWEQLGTQWHYIAGHWER